MANIVTLVCENCASRNYQTNKNKFLPKRLELRKFCKICNTTTVHKETR